MFRCHTHRSCHGCCQAVDRRNFFKNCGAAMVAAAGSLTSFAMNTRWKTFNICSIFFVLCLSVAGCAHKEYVPTAESLTNYKVPEWYQDAKFGIWPMWGVYTVPAFASGYPGHAPSWYSRWMYNTEKTGYGAGYYDHHVKTYGNPSEFGYKDFVPMFKGKKFDPEKWVQLGIDSGAKYFTTLAEFCDGFAMYDSSHTRWNSMDMGPKRDMVGEVAQAARKKGLKFGVSSHLAWQNEFYRWNHENNFDAVDPSTHDLYGSSPVMNAEEVEVWYNRIIEIADKYQPDLYYFDWCWDAGPNDSLLAKHRPAFAAHYYNNAIANGKGTYGAPGVVLNYKRKALPFGTGVLDLERSRMAEVKPYVWQTDTAIALPYRWAYAPDNKYRSADEIVDYLTDVVSKNGNLLLCYGIKEDGTVPEEIATRLRAVGKWLKVCGDAIYATRPFDISGEGPTNPGEHEFHGLNTLTKEDIRFARNKANTVLYATVMDWPGDEATVSIKSLGQLFSAKDIVSIRLLGVRKKLKWRQTQEALEVIFPKRKPYDNAYPLEIVFKNKISKLKKI